MIEIFKHIKSFDGLNSEKFNLNEYKTVWNHILIKFSKNKD